MKRIVLGFSLLLAASSIACNGSNASWAPKVVKPATDTAPELKPVADTKATAASEPPFDLKRLYLEVIQQKGNSAGDHIEEFAIFGKPEDACARVWAREAGQEFYGVVCCDASTLRCRVQWN